MEAIVSFYNKKCILLIPLLLRKLGNTASNTLCVEYCSKPLNNNRVLTGYSDLWDTAIVRLSCHHSVLDGASLIIHLFHLSQRLPNRLAFLLKKKGGGLRSSSYIIFLFSLCFQIIKILTSFLLLPTKSLGLCKTEPLT